MSFGKGVGNRKRLISPVFPKAVPDTLVCPPYLPRGSGEALNPSLLSPKDYLPLQRSLMIEGEQGYSRRMIVEPTAGHDEERTISG